MLNIGTSPTVHIRACLPWPGWLCAICTGFCWIGLWNALRIDWDTNTQYAFAWSVPFVAIGLGWLRWSHRPALENQPARSTRFLVISLLVILTLLYFPLRFLEEANGEWRMIFWIWELECAGLTLGLIALARGFRPAAHFIFPILFTATAVPWPRFVEDPLVQGLARGATLCAVAGLNCAGIPALHFGNLIHFPNAAIGINEACSGMKSFQTSLMLGLLSGELWMLSWKKRTLLVLLGGLFSFAFNSSRIFLLSFITATSGRDAFDRWHDLLGQLEMMACVTAVIATGWLLRRRLPSPERGPFSSNDAATNSIPRATGMSAVPGWLGLLMLATLSVSEIGTELWYRSHDVAPSFFNRWTINAPLSGTGGAENVKMHELPEITRAQLRTNNGIAFSWREPNGVTCYATFLVWQAGRSSAAAAAAHHPDVCLPANGFRYDGEKSRVELEMHGIPMLFRHYLFDSSTRPMHAFYSLSEPGGPAETSLESDLTIRGRFKAAFAGRRNAGRAVLELLMTGADSDEEAVHVLRRVLEKIVSPTPTGPAPHHANKAVPTPQRSFARNFSSAGPFCLTEHLTPQASFG